MPTIAETVVHNLAANGIQRIWGFPGDSLNAVTEMVLGCVAKDVNG